MRVIYKLKIVEDVPIDEYSPNVDGTSPTLEQIQEWEAKNLLDLIKETEKNLGGKVTGVVVVEAL